jgi:cystathionine beta-lyase
MASPPGPSTGPGAGKINAAVGKALSHIDLDGHDLPPSPAPSSPRNGRKYALATELVYTESKDQYGASSSLQRSNKLPPAEARSTIILARAIPQGRI